MSIVLDHVSAVTTQLDKAGIEYCLGGSGLLYSLGLIHTVNDWDITTDSPLDNVKNALQNFRWEHAPSGDYPFASEFRLSILDDRRNIDLIGHFSIISDAGVCHLPVVPAFVWNGVKVGSPEVWYLAYLLMGREDKSALLERYLKTDKVDKEIIRMLMSKPIPAYLTSKLEGLLY